MTILTKQYIKSSNLALLYSKVNSHQKFNKLTDDIFLNYTFNKDDFAMICTFEEDIFPKRRTATKEDYKVMHHIFTKEHLTFMKTAAININVVEII